MAPISIQRISAILWIVLMITFVLVIFISSPQPTTQQAETTGSILGILMVFGILSFIIMVIATLFISQKKRKMKSETQTSKPEYSDSPHKVNRWVLISIVLVLIIVFLLIPKNQIPKTVIQPTNKPVESCTRTVQYDMQPEFQRAISLIIQRYGEYPQTKEMSDYLKSFSNCLAIRYDAELNNSEGYFQFDTSKANLNYFPIFASTKYQKLDDISTATLLSHEIDHVVSFIRLKTIGEKFDCYTMEVNAFWAQFNFASALNTEEKKSFVARMSDNIAGQLGMSPQIQITKNLIDMDSRAQHSCKSTVYDSCWDTEFRSLIEDAIRKEPAYQKQCGL